MSKRKMDKKEQSIFDRLYEKLKKRDFDESDVYTLYILLREYAEKDRMIREIGDLIAHRERDRGIVSDTFSEIYHNNTRYEGKELISLKKNRNLSTVEFRIEFNSLLIELNKQPLDETTLDEVQLFSLSLMQFSTYKFSTIEGKKDEKRTKNNQKGFLFFVLANYRDNQTTISLTSEGEGLVPYHILQIEVKKYLKKDSDYYCKNWIEIYRVMKKIPVEIKRNEEKTLEIWLDGVIL